MITPNPFDYISKLHFYIGLIFNLIAGLLLAISIYNNSLISRIVLTIIGVIFLAMGVMNSTAYDLKKSFEKYKKPTKMKLINPNENFKKY